MNDEEFYERYADLQKRRLEGATLEEMLEMSAVLLADIIYERVGIQIDAGSFFLAFIIKNEMEARGNPIPFLVSQKDNITDTVEKLRAAQARGYFEE